MNARRPGSRVAKIARALEENPRFQSWKDLTREFLEESAALQDDDVLELASLLWRLGHHRFLYAATAAVRQHPTALGRVRWRFLERLGDQMDSWGAVDQFAFLAGPAWRSGQISDTCVLRWTRSPNRWWRRAALVSTVFLNRRSQGGAGDLRRTLMICEPLAGDRDDMVAKAMSWALRELVATDRRAVERFCRRNGGRLPALVKREVRNKLTTGLKNPRRRPPCSPP
jgi:3-methyladenine DNA glycosylase AlkD